MLDQLLEFAKRSFNPIKHGSLLNFNHDRLCRILGTLPGQVLSGYHSRRDDQDSPFSAMSVAAFGQ